MRYFLDHLKIVISCLCMLVAFTTTQAQSAVVDFVPQPANSVVNNGATFSVTIEVQTNGQATSAAEVHLDFDPTYLNVVSLSTGTALPIPLVSETFDNVAGTIDYAAGTFVPNPPTGTFDLLTINFQAMSLVSNTTVSYATTGFPRISDASISGASILNQAIPFTVSIIDPCDPANDVTAPVPNVVNLPDAVGECSVTVTAPTATDDCAGTVTATTTDPTSYSGQGTFTINWTYDDGNGNTSSQTQTVIVDDVTAPVPDVASLPTETGECSASVVAPTATDNCGGIITATTTDPTSYSAQGTFTVNWTYDDGNGNTSSQTQTVIVDDVTAPVPDVASLPTETGECSASVVAPTATDNCGGIITATTTDPTSYSAQGTFTVNWTYDDGNGNTSSQTQTVVVNDITPPVVPTLATESDECSVTLIAPTTTDNCSGTITGTTTDPLTYDVDGTYVVTWNFDDGNGNSSNATQTVIIDDVTAPVPDVVVLPTITADCGVSVVEPTATDNCAGSITATTTDPLTYNTQGTYTINWTYDDGNGNTSSQTQTVIVDDVTAPLTPTLADATGECDVTVTAPTTTDACVGSVTGTTTDPLTYTAQGSYTITWTFDDGNGNSTTATQNVLVDDVTAPQPDVASLPTVTGECGATVTAPTATDNCVGSVTATTTDPTTYSAQGTYTVTWTYDDGNGNTSSQTQTVIVDDVTAPTTPTLATVSDECSVILTAPTTTDNCAGIITGTTTDPLTYNGEGTYVVTWTFDDGNGNSTTATQSVVIDDVTAPVPDVAVLPTATGECSSSVTPPTATDNCGGTITAITGDPLTYNTQGSFTVTWTYNDGNGNIITQTQSVVVDDVTAPATPTIADATDECSVTLTPPTTTDNCGGPITGTTTDPISYTAQGTYVVTWNFDDGNGNSVNATQNVIVDDQTSPTPICQSFSVTLDATGNASITPSQVDNGSNDACGIATLSLDQTAFDCGDVGANTVTLTVTDNNGNVSTCTATITVVDPGICATLNNLALNIGSAGGITCGNLIVPVTVEDYEDIIGGQGAITWDDNVINFVGTDNYAFPEINSLSFNALPGQLNFSYNDPTPINPGHTLSDGDTLFTIEFSVDNGALGSSTTLDFGTIPTLLFFDNGFGVLTPAFNPGTISIPSSTSISGQVVSEMGDVINGVTFTLTGDDGPLFQLGNPAYSFAFSRCGDNEIGPFKNNDVNVYNGVNTLDIIFIQQQILGIAPLGSPYKIIAADVNHDGFVNTIDILLIREQILQQRQKFPEPGGSTAVSAGTRLWAFTPSDFVFADPSDPFPFDTSRVYAPMNPLTDQNFIGMKLGDVDNSWNPAFAKMGSVGEIVLEMEDVIGLPGTEVSIPVMVKDFHSVTGYQFTMNWDPQVMEFARVENMALSTAFGEQLAKDGYLTASWNDPTAQPVSLPDGTVAFNLHFRLKGQWGSQTVLSVNSELTSSEAYNQNLQLLDILTQTPTITVGSTTSLEPLNQDGYGFFQNVPNPFDEQTMLEFELPVQGEVEIQIFNNMGQLVRTFKDTYPKGRSTLIWDGNNESGFEVSAGIYYARMQAGTFAYTLEMQRISK
jgi:hypothetical protein